MPDFTPGAQVVVIDKTLVFTGHVGTIVSADAETNTAVVAIPHTVMIEGVPMQASDQHIRYPASALALYVAPEPEQPATQPAGNQPQPQPAEDAASAESPASEQPQPDGAE